MDRREFLGKALGLTVVSAVTPGILTCACEAVAKSAPLAFDPITVDLTLAKYDALKVDEGSAYVAIPGGNSRGIILNRVSATEYVALSSSCTHQNQRVLTYNASTNKLACTQTNHGPSTYDIYGNVIFAAGGPTQKPLTRYDVTIVNETTLIISDPTASVTIRDLSATISQQIAPNPVRDRATITLDVHKQVNVDLAIYSTDGDKLVTVFEGMLTPGSHSYVLDGSSFATGTYFSRLDTPEGSVVRQLLIVR